MPMTAKITGKMYMSIFCCCMYGVFTERSTFFIISWRWVKNCEADIRMIMMAVTMRTSVSEALRASTFSGLSMNFAAIGAPKMWACRALSTSAWFITPISLPDAMLDSTW